VAIWFCEEAMIGTTGAAVVVCWTLLFIGVIGLLVGFIACLLTRRAWTIKVGLTDLATAVAVALLSGIVVAHYDSTYGELPMGVGLIVVLGVASIPVKHGIQTLCRPHDSI
jgi:hypothetical protein